MPVIRLKEWIPDAADLGNPGSIQIVNAVPSVNSYGPFKSLQITTGALDARPRGAIEAKDYDGNTFNYAGDAAKLYQLSGTTWGDVSIAGGYSTGTEEIWEFARWKNKVLATNYSDDPQQITFGGTAFSALTTAFKCRTIAVVRDFVVVGNTTDGTDGAVTDRVRWSAFNDETDFTVDPSTGSDSRDLKKGAIQRVIGGEYGVIVSNETVFRMTFAGQPVWFQIDEVAAGYGTIARGSVVNLGDRVFYIAKSGFVALIGGAQVDSTFAAAKVNKFIRNDLDEDNLHRVSAVADPRSGRIMWAYPGSGNTGGRPNKIIVYDTNLNRWGLIEDEIELIWRSRGVATTLEELDDFALGSELVTNGDFSTDTVWVKGTGWTIASGVATHAAGSASDLDQAISVTEDLYYRVEFDVSSTTAGSVTPKVGGTSGTAITADDTDIKETIQAGANADIVFSATSDFDGSVDNVSVKSVTSIDDLGISLDSSQWKGGSSQLSAFNEDFESGNFVGAAMAATVETRETEIHAGHRTQLNSFRPLVDGGSVTAQVGTRNTQSEDVTWGPVLNPTSTGRFTTRSNSRYHRFRLFIEDDWNDAIGVSVEPHDARKAGKR